MAKDRTIEYKQKVVNDPANAKAAADLIAHFNAVEAAAKAATAAMREAAGARRYGGGGGATGGGGSGRSSSGGGRGYSSFDAGMRAGSQHLREDQREREASIRARQREVAEMARAAEKEKAILRDRVRANVEASRAIRDAARATLSGHYRARAAGSPSTPASVGAAGIPSDGDFRKHIEGVGRAYAEQERAATQAAQRAAQANRELLGGLRQTATGVGSVARAFVLLGVSGEVYLNRALQVLAKFEAGMQGVSGVTNILAGGAKIVGASRAGMGLRGAIGAVGMGSTFMAGAGAFGVGAGAGFGLGRWAIGEGSFGRMTDWAGLTNWSGERAAATSARRQGIAQRQMDARGRIGQRYDDFNTLGGFALDEAGSRGIGFAAEQSQRNVAAARARSASLESRINAGQAGGFEQFSAERVAAQSNTVTALRAALAIDRERLSLVQAAAAAEKDRTRAIQEQSQAMRAAVGMADQDTLRMANQAAKNRIAGVMNTPELAGALGAIIPEYGQEEAAKIGAARIDSGRFPELAAVMDLLKAQKEAESKSLTVDVIQKVSGEIRLTSDIEEVVRKFRDVLKANEADLQMAVRKELEEIQRDRDAQEALQRGTRG
jgi:hypothetical protein